MVYFVVPVSNYKFAVLGFFAAVIGLILLTNMSSVLTPLIPVLNCGLPPTGWSLLSIMLYETLTGLMILGGAVMFFANVGKGGSINKVISGIVGVIMMGLLVIGVLSSGVFSGGAALGTACIAGSGYLCAGVTYSHSTGTISLTLGQNTGAKWFTANVAFVPQGTEEIGGVPSIFNASTGTAAGTNIVVALGPLNSGQEVTLGSGGTFGALSATVGTPVTTAPVCTRVGGSIWVAYTTTSGGPVQYVQISDLYTRAT